MLRALGCCVCFKGMQSFATETCVCSENIVLFIV